MNYFDEPVTTQLGVLKKAFTDRKEWEGCFQVRQNGLSP